ncbi:MAG: hypothetical protein CW338_10590, partial [Clostridiales bacterium]|nr:hypothetical protein [Clostridiales bacterium]
LYDYLNFLCCWPTYSCGPYIGEDGNEHPGYYLYASDAEWFLKTDGAQYNYGYQPGYFEGIIADIRAVDSNAFSELIDNVQSAKQLAERAIGELDSGNYTWEYMYVERFGCEDYVYSLNAGAELENAFYDLYYAFADWLGNWEM